MKFPLMRNNILRADLDAVIDHLKLDDPILTNGPNIRAFEQEWSQWLGCRYSVFVNSGASANLLSMALLKIRYPDGGEVVTPPLTWISDVASVMQNGFSPVFVDIDPTTLAMDAGKIIAALTERTRAVFITHVQGFDGLTDALVAELKRRNVLLIEDVCESHGARHGDKRLGTFGWLSNFSFYYAHHMSTIEGGMICTDDHLAYQQARMLRSHGMVRELSDMPLRAEYQEENPDLNPDFIFAYPAYNVRNTEIGGIIGRNQLRRLDWIVERRTENFLYFLELIDANIYRSNFKIEGSSNYAFNLIMELNKHNIWAAIQWMRIYTLHSHKNRYAFREIKQSASFSRYTPRKLLRMLDEDSDPANGKGDLSKIDNEDTRKLLTRYSLKKLKHILKTNREIIKL